MARFQIQSSGSALFWQNDWTDWLAAGDTVATQQWTITPDESPTLLANATSTAVTVSGLAEGTKYSLTEVMTTTLGETGTRSITISCEGK